jgi:hypothetical protein
MISASQLALTAQGICSMEADFLVKVDEFLQALFHYYQITADSE